MGVVWRATDQLLDRDVAVKEVRLNEALGDVERANAYKRTLREARTAARLSHRGVVTVFDVAEEDGRPWIIMELIRSRSLDDLLASDGPLSPRRAARVAQQLLSALAHAHASGVLHRDVKPSNVLISTAEYDERAVLTDFGIAQFEGDPRLTQTGMVMGSPGFTAPERIRGGAATPASDLWSLGATIYAACEGRGPYEDRGGAITTMSAIINEDAPLASSADRLRPVISALLRRDPARRPTASAAASMINEMLPALPDKRRGRTPTMLSRSSAGRLAAHPVPPPPPAPPALPALAPTGVDPPQEARPRAAAPPRAEARAQGEARAQVDAPPQGEARTLVDAPPQADARAQGEAPPQGEVPLGAADSDVAARAETPEDGKADTAGGAPAAAEADASQPGADAPDAAKSAAEAEDTEAETDGAKTVEVKVVRARAAEAKAAQA
ncbi:MAG TPA: serine/threonine-protein kinase, partial [Trebonia sp.]